MDKPVRRILAFMAQIPGTTLPRNWPDYMPSLLAAGLACEIAPCHYDITDAGRAALAEAR